VVSDAERLTMSLQGVDLMIQVSGNIVIWLGA